MDYYAPSRAYDWSFGPSLGQNLGNPPDDPNANATASASANGNPNTGSYAFNQNAFDQSAFDQNAFDPAGRFYPPLQPLLPDEQIMLPDDQCDILQHARDSAIDLSNGWALQNQIKREPDIPRNFSHFNLQSPAPTPTRSPSTSSFVFSTANSPGGFGSADLAQIDTAAFLANRAAHVHPNGADRKSVV